jgi:hypothetical protein
MIKDEAETIRDLANQLLEEDVSVERRQRIARKIITHARSIKAACMADVPSGFVPVSIRYADWLCRAANHDGERIIWSDGSLHIMPETDSEYITVLMRLENSPVDPAIAYGAKRQISNILWCEPVRVWESKFAHLPDNYG